MDEDTNSVINQAKSSDQINLTLQQHCEEYLKLKEDLKEKNQILKSTRENDPKWADFKEHQEKAKELKGEIQAIAEYQDMKEEIDTIKDRKQVIEATIIGLLEEKQVVSYEHGPGDFSVKKGFQFKKREEDPQNSKKMDEMTKKFNQ